MRLEFRDILGLNKKTITQHVSSGIVGLGEIKWYAQWRRYCFFPFDQVLFDASCLKEIQDHLNEMMAARKNNNDHSIT